MLDGRCSRRRQGVKPVALASNALVCLVQYRRIIYIKCTPSSFVAVAYRNVCSLDDEVTLVSASFICHTPPHYTSTSYAPSTNLCRKERASHRQVKDTGEADTLQSTQSWRSTSQASTVSRTAAHKSGAGIAKDEAVS